MQPPSDQEDTLGSSGIDVLAAVVPLGSKAAEALLATLW